MTYIEFINNILNTRGRFNCGKHPVTGEPLSWVKLENKNC